MVDAAYVLAGICLLVLIRALGHATVLVCADEAQWDGAEWVADLLIGVVVFVGLGMLTALLAQGRPWFSAAVAGVPLAAALTSAGFLAVRSLRGRPRRAGHTARLATVASHTRWAGAAIPLVAAVFIMSHRPQGSASPVLWGSRTASHVRLAVSSDGQVPGCCLLQVVGDGRILTRRHLVPRPSRTERLSLSVPRDAEVRIELLTEGRRHMSRRVAWLDFH